MKEIEAAKFKEQCLALLDELDAEGRSYAQIAEVESKSPHTVRNAMTRMRRKLGIKTNQELLVWAVRGGLLDDADAGD